MRGSSGQAIGFGLLDFAGPGQGFFDGRNSGKVSKAPSFELEGDSLFADAGERRAAALVGRPLVVQSQDRADEPLSRFVPDMFGDSASVPKPGHAESFIAVSPLGEPQAPPLHVMENFYKTNSSFKKLDCPGSPFIFAFALHRPILLPFEMVKSLGDV